MVKQKKERAPTRNLVRWNDATDKKLLLAIQWACNQKNVRIPWDMVGQEIESYVTGGAVVQHLAKLRDRMVMEGLPVPPPLTRGGRVPKANSVTTGTDVKAPRTLKRSKAFKSIEKPDEMSADEYDDDYDVDRISEGSQEYGDSPIKRMKALDKKRKVSNIKKEESNSDGGDSDIVTSHTGRKRLRPALMPKVRKEDNTAYEYVGQTSPTKFRAEKLREIVQGKNTKAGLESDSGSEERHAAGAGFWGWDGNTDKGLVILKVGPKLAGNPAVNPQFQRKLSKASSDPYDSEHDSASFQLSEQLDNNDIPPLGYRTYIGRGRVEVDDGNSLDSGMFEEDGFRPQFYGQMNDPMGYYNKQLNLRVPTNANQSGMVAQSANFFKRGDFPETSSSIENTWPGRMEMATTPRHQEVRQLGVPQNHNLLNGLSTNPFNGYVVDGGHFPNNAQASCQYTSPMVTPGGADNWHARNRSSLSSTNNNFLATPMGPINQQGDFSHHQLQFGEPNALHQEQFFANDNLHSFLDNEEWDNLFWPREENDGGS
ncbi:MAG: hypothetical protein Q9167_006980 [Letrouitia subvulpina]